MGGIKLNEGAFAYRSHCGIKLIKTEECGCITYLTFGEIQRLYEYALQLKAENETA